MSELKDDTVTTTATLDEEKKDELLFDKCDIVIRNWSRKLNIYIPIDLIPVISQFHNYCDIVMIYSEKISLINAIAPQSQPKSESISIDKMTFPFHASLVQRDKLNLLFIGGSSRKVDASNEFKSLNIETMELTQYPTMNHPRVDAGMSISI